MDRIDWHFIIMIIIVIIVVWLGVWYSMAQYDACMEIFDNGFYCFKHAWG